MRCSVPSLMRGVCHPRFVAADRCGAGANNAIFRRLWQQATSPSASHAAALAAGGAGATCSPRRGDVFVDLNVRGVWLRHAHQDAGDGAGPTQPSTATTATLAHHSPAAPTTLRSASDVHAEPTITTTATATAGERDTSHQQQLRPYQSACIEACLQAAREGVTRQAVSLPVGSGKTVVFANLIQALPPLRPSATRVLVLAHRTELVQQAAATIARTCPTLRVAVEQGTQVREALTACPSHGFAPALLHAYARMRGVSHRMTVFPCSRVLHSHALTHSDAQCIASLALPV
jgi:hypothetical protein